MKPYMKLNGKGALIYSFDGKGELKSKHRRTFKKTIRQNIKNVLRKKVQSHA